MNTLKTKEVYLMPEKDNGKVGLDINDLVRYGFIEKHNLYCLTREELENVVKDAFKGGWQVGFSEGADIDKWTCHLNEIEYIANLLK